MIKCGEFPSLARTKIVIEKRTDTTDSYGGSTVVWSKFKEVWAWVKPVTGRELYTNAKLTSRVTHTALIRYIDTLRLTDTAAKYRVTFDDKTLEIDYITSMDEHDDSYGKVFQRLFMVENGAGNAG